MALGDGYPQVGGYPQISPVGQAGQPVGSPTIPVPGPAVTADAIADALETAATTAPADLARIQSSASGDRDTRYDVLGPAHVALILPSATVTAALTRHISRVVLDNFPADWWPTVAADGANIRAYDLWGQMLPIDVTAIDTVARVGDLYVMCDVLDPAAETLLHIVALPGVTQASPAGSGVDRTALWTDYERVYMPGSTLDRTGKSSGLVKTGALEFGTVRKSPNLAPCHQGVAVSGEHYYAIHTSDIRKYDQRGNLLIGPVNISTTGLGASVNHFGAGEVIGDELFVTCEYYPASPYNHQYLCVYDAATLAWKRNIDISATLREISGVCYDGQYLYVTDYTNGASIPRYLIDGTPAGVLTLSTALPTLQGITYYDGDLYVSQDQIAGVGHVYKVNKATGAVSGPVYSAPADGSFEGISHDASGLVVTEDCATSGVFAVHISRSAKMLDCDGTQFAKSDAPVLSAWTLGVHMRMTKFPGRHLASVSYGGPATTGSTDRATIAYRNTGKISTWDNAGGWLSAAADAALWADNIVQVAQTTTGRSLCVNGAIVSDTTAATIPVGAPAHIYIGTENDTRSNDFVGQIGLVTLRSGAASGAAMLATNLFFSGSAWALATAAQQRVSKIPQARVQGLGSAASQSYSTGVWTPGIGSTGTAPVLTLASSVGTFVKFDKIVNLSFRVNTGVVTAQGTGNFKLTNLPFPAANEFPALIWLNTAATSQAKPPCGRTITSDTGLYIGYFDGQYPTLAPASAVANDGWIVGSVTYVTL